MPILSVDPGNIESAYCLIGEDYKPIEHAKLQNDELMDYIWGLNGSCHLPKVMAIEMVASYGMAVGKSIFDTCVMIGRLTEAAKRILIPVDYVFRIEEKVTICHDSKAKDTNIRQALIDRFAKHDFKSGKGTKKDPDWFYGFAKDEWAAYAVGVTWMEKKGCVR